VIGWRRPSRAEISPFGAAQAGAGHFDVVLPCTGMTPYQAAVIDYGDAITRPSVAPRLLRVGEEGLG
jgi:hypothetical protein